MVGVGVGAGFNQYHCIRNVKNCTSWPPGAVAQEFDSEFAHIVLLVLLLVLCCGLLHACVDRPQEVPQLPEA